MGNSRLILLEEQINRILKSWRLTHYVPNSSRINAVRNRIVGESLKRLFDNKINSYIIESNRNFNSSYTPAKTSSKQFSQVSTKIAIQTTDKPVRKVVPLRGTSNGMYKDDTIASGDKHEKIEEQLRNMGYGSYLTSASFINIDNIVRMALLKPNPEKVLRMLLTYNEDHKTIYNYIRDKHVESYVRERLDFRRSLNSDESYLYILIKNHVGNITITSQKKRSSFRYLNDNSYTVKWADVRFRKGEYTILPPEDGSIKFSPCTIHDQLSTTSLNYIRDFIQEKLPNVTGVVNRGKLTLDNAIDLGIAIRIMGSPIYKQIIQKRMTSGVRPGFEFPSSPMSFTDSMSKARSMSKEDFEKYKSKFISFLLKKHIPTYKVIPCTESISHAGTLPIIENAFIFTLRSSNSGCVLLAVENLNPDRATLLFKVSIARYEEALMHVHSFLKSDKINKRSTLRVDLSMSSVLGTYDFAAVNHRDEAPFTWRTVMENKLHYL